MTQVNVTSRDFLADRGICYVEMRRNWWDEWTYVPYLTVVQYTNCIAPQMPQALLAWDAGRILRADALADGYVDTYFFPEVTNPSHAFLSAHLDGAYVRIMRVVPPTLTSDGTIVQDWIGLIAGEARQLYGNNLGQTDATDELIAGTQTLTAVGLEHLLNRHRIYRAAFLKLRDLSASPPEDEIGWIDWAPDFNRSDRRLGEISNKCYPSLQGPTFSDHPIWAGVEAFGDGTMPDGWTLADHLQYAAGPDAATLMAVLDPSVLWWDHDDIAQYLLRFFQPFGNEADNPPHGGLHDPPPPVPDGQLQFHCLDYSALYPTAQVVQQEGRTVWDIFNELADPALGLGWRVVCPDAEPGQPAEVRFFSLLEEAIPLTDYRTLPANPEVIQLDTADDRRMIEPALEQDFHRQYSSIRVLGERMVVAFTLRGVSLDRDWTDDEEQAYKDALTGGLVGPPPPAWPTDEIELAKLNDEYRRGDAFEHVFARFRVPEDWSWIKGYPLPANLWAAIPAVDPASGDVDPTTLSDALWPTGRPFLRWIPLPDGTRGKPFAAIWSQMTNRFHWCDQATDDLEASASVSVADDRQAVVVRYSRCNHWLAAGHWEGHEVGAAKSLMDLYPLPLNDYALDWEDLRITVALETDVRPSLIVGTSAPSQTGYGAAVARELTLFVPEARLWYRAPGTDTHAMDSDGAIVVEEPGDHSPDGVLVYDRKLLETVAAVAQVWYGRDRRSVVFRRAGLDVPCEPGQLLDTLDAGTGQAVSVRTVVSSVTVNNATPAGEVTVKTGESDLNPVLVVRRVGL